MQAKLLAAFFLVCIGAFAQSPFYGMAGNARAFRGRPISGCTPTDGQVYVYNAANADWECGAGGAGGSVTAGATVVGGSPTTGGYLYTDAGGVLQSSNGLLRTGPGQIKLYDPTPTTGTTRMLIQAGAGDASGDRLFRVANNSAADMAWITRDGVATFLGNLTSGGSIIGSGTFYPTTTGRSLFTSGANGNMLVTNSILTDFSLFQFGGTTSSFPAIKRFGDAAAIRAADDTVPAFAALTACATGGEGALIPVSDSSTGTYGATITGGGANHVLAYCNGTNWTVH